nr:double zinc ribbon domain-containing protein [Acidocella sp.]
MFHHRVKIKDFLHIKPLLRWVLDSLLSPSCLACSERARAAGHCLRCFSVVHFVAAPLCGVCTSLARLSCTLPTYLVPLHEARRRLRHCNEAVLRCPAPAGSTLSGRGRWSGALQPSAAGPTILKS